MASMEPQPPCHGEQILRLTDNSVLRRSSWKGLDVIVKAGTRTKDQGAMDQWHREVRNLKIVQTEAPEFPQLLDYDAEVLSITLAYSRGLSLDEYLDPSKFSALSRANCLNVWAQLASALEYIHSQGMMHDDVKPENIIWDQETRQAVLVDFGAAHEITTASFDESGTPCYVAPEYLQRLRTETFDIWALGVTMMFAFRYVRLPEREWLLPGVFENQKDLQAMQDWLQYIFELRDQLPPSMHLLTQMLHEDPRARISATELRSGIALLGASE